MKTNFKYANDKMREIDKVEESIPSKGKLIVGTLFIDGNVCAYVHISKKRQATSRKQLYNGLFLGVQVINKPEFDMAACEEESKSYNQKLIESMNRNNPWTMKPVSCEEMKQRFDDGINAMITDAVNLVHSEYSRQIAMRNIGNIGDGKTLSQQERSGLSILDVNKRRK